MCVCILGRGDIKHDFQGEYRGLGVFLGAVQYPYTVGKAHSYNL